MKQKQMCHTPSSVLVLCLARSLFPCPSDLPTLSPQINRSNNVETRRKKRNGPMMRRGTDLMKQSEHEGCLTLLPCCCQQAASCTQSVHVSLTFYRVCVPFLPLLARIPVCTTPSPNLKHHISTPSTPQTQRGRNASNHLKHSSVWPACVVVLLSYALSQRSCGWWCPNAHVLPLSAS